MLKRVKKLALALIAVGILCGSFSMSANAETKEVTIPADAIASGVVDEDYGQITWCIDKDGELVVNGTGEVKDPMWYPNEMTPWLDFNSKIKSAKIFVTGMTDASYLFAHCDNLTSVDFSGLETEHITNMAWMFCDCEQLTSLDLSGLDTSNVKDMSYMFYGCKNLIDLDVTGFDTSNVKDMGDMFNGCGKLKELDVTGFDTSKVTNMGYMFGGCSSLTELNVTGLETENVRTMGGIFSGCNNLTSLDLSGFDTSNATHILGMFQDCAGLTSLDLSGFDTSNVVNMYGMFSGCTNLTSLDLSGFDTSDVTDMAYMFEGCSSLSDVDVSKFETANVTTMQSMFSDCTNLTSLDLDGFDTSNVTNMGWMFHDCGTLERLDLRNFDMQKVTVTSWMLDGCENLTTIHTPFNVTKSVILPGIWHDVENIKMTELPINLSESITITKAIEIADESKKVTEVFKDVYEDWYVEYVQYVYDNNLMTGIKGTTQFQPNANITKAQVAQVLYNMADQPNVTEKRVFTDLKDVYASEWYANAVAWAYNNNIVTGDTNAKKFFPNSDVTREQLAIMMYRYAKYKGMNTSESSNLAGLKNAENVSNWALDGVKWAVGSGLISGIEKNGVKDLSPQGNATRAQMAAILQRFCEN